MSIIAIMMLMLLRNNFRVGVGATSAPIGFISSPSQLLHHRHNTPSISIASMSTSAPMSWEMITNQSSKTVKLFKSIHKNKSKRNESGFTIAEGVRLVTDILSDEKSRKLVKRIIVSESIIDGRSNNEYQQQLEHWLNVVEDESRQRKAEFASGIKNEGNAIEPVTINIGSDQVLAACSGTVTTQGVVALMEIPKSLDASSVFLETANESSKPPFYVILDGLQDPGNVGTILRSCAASHVSALILLPDSCDVWNPKAIRAAMGASFRVPVIELNGKDYLIKALDMLNDCGIDSDRVFAATMESGDGRSSIAHYDVNFDEGAAIILGKEGEGLREEVRNAIGQGLISTVHIPMAEGTESLNAAVCGSIIMFERMRQLSVIQSANTN